MKEWVLKYWIEALFSLVISGTALAYKKLSCRVTGRVKEQEAIKLGIQALLRDRIIQSYNHYIEMCYIPIYALENVLAMYASYHALGGNGTVTKLIEALKELPTEKKKGE